MKPLQRCNSWQQMGFKFKLKGPTRTWASVHESRLSRVSRALYFAKHPEIIVAAVLTRQSPWTQFCVFRPAAWVFALSIHSVSAEERERRTWMAMWYYSSVDQQWETLIRGMTVNGFLHVFLETFLVLVEPVSTFIGGWAWLLVWRQKRGPVGDCWVARLS